MTGGTATKPIFRVHFHDGTSVDVQAANSLIAEKNARNGRPGSFVRKIKLVRDPSLSSASATSVPITANPSTTGE